MNQTLEDPVEHGIREWQKLKAAAEEAIACARKAETETAYLKGQNELLVSQKRNDDERMQRVQQHADEMELMVAALGAAVLDIIDKRQQGYYRRAGAIETKPAHLRTTNETSNMAEIEGGLHELASRLNKSRARPGGSPPIIKTKGA